jgi:hypothetical protein
MEEIRLIWRLRARPFWLPQLGLDRMELPTSAVQPVIRKRSRPAGDPAAAAAAAAADSSPGASSGVPGGSTPASLAAGMPFDASGFATAALERLQASPCLPFGGVKGLHVGAMTSSPSRMILPILSEISVL